MKLWQALFILPLVACSRASAQQQSAKSCDVPLVVTHPDNSLITDLTTGDLSIQIGEDQGSVESLAIDSGPKRIAILIDGSGRVPDDEWKLQTGMAAKFIAHARSDDRFIFSVILGAGSTPSALLPSVELNDRLGALDLSRPSVVGSSEPIFDALLASARRLDPPQFGDTIFLFGHHEDSGSKANPDQVLEFLLRRRLRFYGLSFSDPLRGKLPPNFDPNKPLPPSLGPTKLEQMALTTGNYFSFHPVRDLNIAQQMPLLEELLGDIYARIARPYRLRIRQSDFRGPLKFKVVVSNMDGRNIRTSGIYFPRSIYSCNSLPQQTP